MWMDVDALHVAEMHAFSHLQKYNFAPLKGLKILKRPDWKFLALKDQARGFLWLPVFFLWAIALIYSTDNYCTNENWELYGRASKMRTPPQMTLKKIGMRLKREVLPNKIKIGDAESSHRTLTHNIYIYYICILLFVDGIVSSCPSLEGPPYVRTSNVLCTVHSLKLKKIVLMTFFRTMISSCIARLPKS